MAEEPKREAKPRLCAVRPRLTDVGELTVLLARLRENVAAARREDFERGALLPDGRLDLCKQSLGADGAHAVAGALAHNTTVKALLLGANQTGPAGGHAVAAMLRENHTVEAVYLGCNRLGAEGAEALGAALKGHPSVQQLWLKRNEIGDAGVLALAGALRDNGTLRTLDLVCDGLSPRGLAVLVEALTTPGAALEHLFVGGNALGPEGGALLATLVRRCRSLTTLSLSCCGLGDLGAERLAAGLAENTTLTLLDVSSNGLGVAGVQALAEALAKHPGLRELKLGYAPSAAVLGAQHNHYGDRGAAALAAMLVENRGLQSLDVARAGVSVEGFVGLLTAAEAHPRLRSLSGLRLNGEAHERLMALACRGAEADPAGLRRAAAMAQVRSVFRTAVGAPDPGPDPDWYALSLDDEAPLPPLPRLTVDPADVRVAVAVLDAVARDPQRFGADDPALGGLYAAVLTVSRGQRRRAKRAAPTPKRRPSRPGWRLAETAMNRQREAQGIALADVANRALRRGLEATSEGDAVDDARQRRCYICRRPHSDVHPFYPLHCGPCGDFDFAKRSQSAELSGRVALVTGGRIKIGFEVATRLLRAGASVVVTTRFALDAAKRFAALDDFASWSSRLRIHALDLRDMMRVEHFARRLDETLPRLDVVIHNAAQTVWRPEGFYSALRAQEAAARAELDPKLARLLAAPEAPSVSLKGLESLYFPFHGDDGYGQPLDLRETNSWRLRLGEISTEEAASTYAINALAPFVLLNGLRACMARTEGVDKWVVNVSAVEGQFAYRNKTPRHPHTNMAKAALNMLTRTAAADWAGDRIFMTAVDTGWVTNENPWSLSERMAAMGFQPPLDVVDGAARVLDPVFSGVNAGQNLYGVFLKDYRVAPW
ncbi:MAG: SDR family NAD(P)-dependent oxidoreductase [Myxococcales bacterium]|nr:SDR family NAD(P)-dependent oxidoreductase [Myxococcales bacterium]